MEILYPYAQEPVLVRQDRKPYTSVQDVIERLIKPTTLLIDLGCADLVGTYKSIENGYQVVGVDTSLFVLKMARLNLPNANLINADIKNLPIKTPKDQEVCFLMMDVLEHLERSDAVNFLKDMKSRFGSKIILTMPIISFQAIPTLYEFLMVLKNGKRPDTGLFDKTHGILTDTSGHKKIFSESGYCVVESKIITNDGIRGRVYDLLSRKLIPILLAKVAGLTLDEALDRVNAYQCLYVIEPK